MPLRQDPKKAGVSSVGWGTVSPSLGLTALLVVGRACRGWEMFMGLREGLGMP